MIDMRRIIDNRKCITAQIKIKPSDSKENDFHLALAEYLYKELKSQGIHAIKNDVVLKIKLQKKHEEKYQHIIIDCLAGKMYLRGKDITDKYFGRLRRFHGGHRASDAYHCVSQSATRIISRINDIIGNSMEVFGETERIDLRKNKSIVITDMRKVASAKRTDMRKIASVKRIDMRKSKTIIEVRDHRRLYAWLENGRVVASAHDDRVIKYIERKDLRKVSLSHIAKVDVPASMEAIRKLGDGNHRFANSISEAKNDYKKINELYTNGQHPYAIVLACSDSRVTPEIIFDAELGDLFVIRVAGNVVNDDIADSIEFAAQKFKCPLIVVMGHCDCDVVNTTIDKDINDVKELTDKIKPSVDKYKDKIDNRRLFNEHVTDANIGNSIELLMKHEILKRLVDAGTLRIIGAKYDLGSGIINFY